jgi:N-acetylmuramoyl-L-alanine amidase
LRPPHVLTVAVLLLSIGLSPPLLADTTRKLKDGGHRERAVLTAEREIFLQFRPGKGEGWAALARRYLPPGTSAQRLPALTGQAEPRRRENLLLPFEELSGRWKVAVLEALFPDDEYDPEGWRHTVTYTKPGQGETLYRLALWFTGSGANSKAVLEVNGLTSTGLAKGQVILIPSSLLRPELRAALGQRLIRDKAPPPYPFPGLEPALTFHHNTDLGEYAEYRLKKGETLYTDVVIRFTGRILAEEVNELAAKIARDSFIPDVQDIPINYPVHIRSEYLLPQFLYPGHARYEAQRAHERQIAEVAETVRREVRPGRRRDLRDVLILIDPGHGGSDPGADYGAVWEHDYCYDIAVRLKAALERTTKAHVKLLVEDTEDGLKPIDRDRLRRNRREVVTTRPPYAPTDATRSLNLRCFLANYHVREWERKGGDRARCLLVSIHADALHHSVRGTMIYYPDTRYTNETFSKAGEAFYLGFQEVKTLKGRCSFPLDERKRAEASSRALGEQILSKLREGRFPVHQNLPLRGSIRRQTRFVPAILKFTWPQHKALVEVLNLNNVEDRKLMTSYRWRQNYAEYLSRALTDHLR